ncbi:DUF5686 family protein [Bacteroidota bacterium]
MRLLYYFSFAFLISGYLFGQQVILKGRIQDNSNQEPLRFANIRIDGTSRGTSANVDGQFEMRLEPGDYTFITSFIGFKSDTLNLELNGSRTINISLIPIAINLPDVVVLPGTNPAIEIIQNAIAAKHRRNNRLNSYIFDSYTKGLIKTTEDIVAGDNSIGLEFSEPDTADLMITGILENQSRGYYKKPDYRKDEIIARKQTANAPSTINLLTGGRLIQDFYGNDIEFFGRPLPSPLNDDALDFYYFMIEDRVAMDNMEIFQIYFVPREDDPGFEGRIFIADSTYTLMKVDLWLNRFANPGRLLDTVSIFQQFVPFEDDIYMPIDYRLAAEGNFLGIAKFGFELHSIFYNYEINADIDDSLFDMAIIKVSPEADKRDSTYWQEIEIIPNTKEELFAYQRIDSVSAIPRTFWDNFSLLSTRTRLSDNLSISGPLSLYHFNNVEGHGLNFALFYNDFYNKRMNSSVHFSYGFSDKKFKKDLSFEYLIGEYRTSSISFNLFDKVTDLFGESNYYNILTSTLTSWFGKYDFRDYYYTNGFNLKVKSEIFPILELGIGIRSRTDKNAQSNSNFSLLYPNKSYHSNKPIYETKVNSITASLKLDFRKYIEDGTFRRRISVRNAIPIIRLDATLSDPSLFKSLEEFSMYKLNVTGNFSTVESAQMRYSLNGIYSTGAVPFQMLYALPGNIESAGKDFTFRTLRLGEVVGDRAYAVMLLHDFRDELFRATGIPFIKNLELTLSVYANMAWTNISDESRQLLPATSVKIFSTPFYEAGFSLGHMLVPVELEFTWRLNHFGGTDFVFGFNTFAL